MNLWLPTNGKGLLPYPARVRLMRAAGTPIPDDDDPTARTRAVNEAIKYVRAAFPYHFRPEANHEAETDQRPPGVPYPL